MEWLPVNSTGKISNGCIRDLKFNHRLYKKTYWCLDIIRSERHKLKLSKKNDYIIYIMEI